MTADTSPVAPPIRALPVKEVAAQPTATQPPIQATEFCALLALVILWDVGFYHAAGFAGHAACIAITPILLWLGSHYRVTNRVTLVLLLMILAVAMKLVWLGSPLLVGCGFLLLTAFAMNIAGACPYVPELFAFASRTVVDGYKGLRLYAQTWRPGAQKIAGLSRRQGLGVALPAVTCLVFSSFFVLANPNLLRMLEQQLSAFGNWLASCFGSFPGLGQILFWGVVVWIATGLLRPRQSRHRQEKQLPPLPPDNASLFTAAHNTLLTVIVLFAAYLLFEFATLWFREFPAGFYYAGYAHQGAAWLTLALAAATVVLSLIFRGSILADPRSHRLRYLAWIWSLENLLLGMAVFNRLFIYIGYNGMTRMRIVGLFGITAVIAGFCLVVWKIWRNRSFLWLLRYQLWALGLTIYLFALVPLDWVVVRYNVGRVLAGHPAPSVQITEQPISAEGIAELLPLVECQDDVIREGVRAMLAEQFETAVAKAEAHSRQGWTAHQSAERAALAKLQRAQGVFASQYEDRTRRSSVIERFQKYAYQWY